jgi:NADH:ubiquinone oxidoreductase subunit
MSFLSRLTASLAGRRIGTDRFGNAYFESRRLHPTDRLPRRWVVYAGRAEASAVPPEWWGWLHHTTAAPLPERPVHPWQKDHQPSMTGTPQAYRPFGHDYVGGRRHATSGDYEAWTPGS